MFRIKIFLGRVLLVFLTMMIVSRFLIAGPPLWISGNDKRWPQDKYLTGIGAADSISAAQDKARAEIAKVFKVAIEQVAVEKSAQSIQDARTLSSSIDVEQKTTTSVSDKIEGIEIAQIWYDKKEKLYWALAVLNKQKYASLLSNRILDLESRITSSLQKAKDISDSLSNLERLKYLTSALESIELREDLSIRQRAVGAVGSISDIDEISRKEIEDEIVKIKRATIFNIVIGSDSGAVREGTYSGEDDVKKLKELLKEKLVYFGFQVSDIAESGASYPVLEFRFTVTPFVRQSAKGSSLADSFWKYARWEGYFEVKDKGRIIISAGASGSESNPDENVAVKKAQISGLKIIGDLFEKKLVQEFGNIKN